MSNRTDNVDISGEVLEFKDRIVNPIEFVRIEVPTEIIDVLPIKVKKIKGLKIEPKVEPKKIEPKVEPKKIKPKVEPKKIKPKVEPKKIKPKVEPKKIKPKVGPLKKLVNIEEHERLNKGEPPKIETNIQRYITKRKISKSHITIMFSDGTSISTRRNLNKSPAEQIKELTANTK